MNQEQLQAMRERCEKATQGPWYVDDGTNSDVDGGNNGTSVMGMDNYTICETGNQNIDDLNPHNSVFIASARTDLPEALDHIAQLTDDLHAEIEKSFWQAKEIERLRGELMHIRDGHQWGIVELREIARQALAGEST